VKLWPLNANGALATMVGGPAGKLVPISRIFKISPLERTGEFRLCISAQLPGRC
jgi:hypothetical protein